jgi:hypothetical protein
MIIYLHHQQNKTDNMKVLLVVSLIALAVSTAFAQYAEFYNGDTEIHGQGECQQVSLGSCRDYVKDRCREIKLPITQPWEWSQPWKWAQPLKWGLSSCHEVQKRCCRQLEKMSPQCRCKAIKKAIQGDILLRFQPSRMSKVMEKAKSVPVLCKMAPFDCKISMTDGYY